VSTGQFRRTRGKPARPGDGAASGALKEVTVSDVSSGTVLTLVVPLALLMVVLGLWALAWWRLRRPGRRSDSNAPVL